MKGLGEVVMNEGGVINFASRKLKPHEEKYSTHDLELAVVMLALELCMHYLDGRSCILKTDHQSLHYTFVQRVMNSRHT